MGKLRRRIGYLWRELHPDGVELLSAALALGFAAVLAYRGRDANALAGAYWYAALCLLSGALLIVGVLIERTWLRIAGLLLGTVFWVTLSYVFLRMVPGSISWLCFVTLALAQLWAVRRHVEGGR